MAYGHCVTRTHRNYRFFGHQWPCLSLSSTARWAAVSKTTCQQAKNTADRSWGQNRDISRQTVSTELSMPSEIDGFSADFLWKWNVHDHLHKCSYSQPAISNLHRSTVPLYDPAPVCRHDVAVRYLCCCLLASVRQIAVGFTSCRRK